MMGSLQEGRAADAALSLKVISRKRQLGDSWQARIVPKKEAGPHRHAAVGFTEQASPCAS
jgi:hypothetical protein